MKRLVFLVLIGGLALGLAERLQGQEIRYRAEISAADRVNSRGAPLKTLREFLRQDRFNVHGGHHLDPGDTPDPRFGTVEARGEIESARLVVKPGLEGQVIQGGVTRLEVTVTGKGKGLVLAVAVAPDEATTMTEKTPPDPATTAAEPGNAPPPPKGFRLAYTTTLGNRDWADSNGTPLSRLRDVLKQDRANVNRLGQADPGDERDPLFTSASERRRWDSMEMLLDPVLAGPLSRHEPVKVVVLLPDEGSRAFVARPEAESLVGLETSGDLLSSRQWKVEALVASGDPGAIDASRDLVRLMDLLSGRDHEDAVLARVNLATRLLEKGLVEEAKPMLEEIETDFRAAASREVDPASIIAVIGFLIEAHDLLGAADHATKLLEEFTESPGREQWRLDEAQREALRKRRGGSDAAGARPTYEEALAAWEQVESNAASSVADRLATLVMAISLHPRHRGEDYELLLQRLTAQVEKVNRDQVGDDLFFPLAEALITLAFDSFRGGDPAAARSQCEETLALLDSPGRQEQAPAISARHLLVRLAIASGQADEAEALAKKHLDWAKGIFQPCDARFAELAMLYFELLADRGDASAIETSGRPFAEVSLAASDLPDPAMRLSWHEQIAGMVYEAGDEARADAWYREAIAAVDRDPGLVPVLASCYSRWGFLYESSGHYGRAEAIWKEGLEVIAGREALIADYVSLLQDLSLVRKHYRDEEGAIALIEQSRVLAAEKLGTDSAEYAVACNNLVLPLNAVGRGEQALKRADEALRIAESHPDREWGRESSIIFRNNRAILLMNTDPKAAAEIYAGLVEEMERDGRQDEHQTALYLMNLGAARRENGQDDAAEASYLRALEVLRLQGWEDRRNLAFILDALAGLALRKGQLAEAADRVRESVRLADEFLSGASAIASESEKLALGTLFDHGRHLHILLAAGATEEACELSLRTKGTVLDQSMREAKALQGLAKDEAKQRLYTEWRARGRQLNRAALELQQGGLAEGSEPALAALRQEVKRLQGLLLGGEGGGVVSGAAVDLAAVRSRLGEAGCFLEMVVAHDEKGEAYLGAFEITRDAVRWTRLATVEQVRIALTGFRGAIDAFLAAKTAGDRIEPASLLEAASKQLHGLVWEPLETPRRDGVRLLLCADGILHFVPFAVLLDRDGNFPGEDQVFDYVGSARDFCRKDDGSKRDLASAVVVGGPDYRVSLGKGSGSTRLPADRRRAAETETVRGSLARSGAIRLAPLPGAEREAGLIAETLVQAGAEVNVLTAAAATEKAFAGAVAPGIVHVATHGIFFDRDFGSLMTEDNRASADPMMRGALALAGAQDSVEQWAESRFPEGENDGWLFAAEAVQLDLGKTELVTLSACETGIGDLASGEGVIGLRRAFLAAGARHVLSTLWPISDDMTVELMRDFYERIGRGEVVTAAFAGAQGEALRVFRQENARAEAIALFGAFVMCRAGE